MRASSLSVTAVVALALAVAVARCTPFQGASDRVSDPSDASAGEGGGAATADGGASAEVDASIDGPPQPVVLATNESVTAIAVDPAGLFWANTATSQIRVLAPGSTQPATFSSDGAKAPSSLALVNGSAYWGDPTNGTLTMKSFKPGSAAVAVPVSAVPPITLAPTPGGRGVFWNTARDIHEVGGSGGVILVSGGYMNVWSVASDDSARYWTDSAAGNVFVLTSQPPKTVATGQNDCRSIAAYQGTVYWANYGLGLPGKGVIMMNGSLGAMPLATAETTPEGLAADGTGVYWIERNKGTLRHASATVAPETLAMGDDYTGAPGGYGQPIALDADTIYWASYGDGKIQSLKKKH